MIMNRLTGTIALIGLVGALTSGCGNADSKDRMSEAKPAADASSTWYVMIGGERAGPFQTNVLERQAAIGCLGANTQVWQEGRSGWVGLSSAIPGTVFGGSQSDGEAWSKLLDSAAKLREPTPANGDTLTAQERSVWIQRTQGTLTKIRRLQGRFGPETAKADGNRLLGSRTLVRLLSMDARQAAAEGDVDRALEDIELMGSLAHQQMLLTMAPDPSRPNRTFDLGPLLSMASMVMMLQLLESNEMSSVELPARSRASESLAWVDPAMVTFIRDQCSASSSARTNCEGIIAMIQSPGSP